MTYQQINRLFGATELFVIDQLLKGRIPEGSHLVDAGCGEGRNLTYFLKHNYRIDAFDHYPMAIKMLELVGRTATKDSDAKLHCFVDDIRNISLKNESADVVMCIAVLHDLNTMDDFERALNELERICKSGGLLLIQTAGKLVEEFDLLEDVNIRTDEKYWNAWVDQSAFDWEEPIKTITVDGIKKLHQLVLIKNS